MARIVTGTANCRDLVALSQGAATLPAIHDRLKTLSSPLLKEIYDQLDPLQDLKEAIEKTIVDEPPFVLREGGMINLKTDSDHLHEYTKNLARGNGLPGAACCDDIYGTGFADEVLSIKTTYEQRFLQEGLPITYLRFGFGDRREFETIPFAPDEALLSAGVAVQR